MDDYSKMLTDFRCFEGDSEELVVRFTQLRQQVGLHQHLLQVYGFERDLEFAHKQYQKKEADEEALRAAFFAYWRLSELGRMLDKSSCKVQSKKNKIETLAWFEAGSGRSTPPAGVFGLGALRPFSEVDPHARIPAMGYMDEYKRKVITVSDTGVSVLSKNRGTMLASQQLAIAKWGGFTIKGSSGFVRNSIQVAVEYGLQAYIRNLELKPQIEFEIARQAHMSELYPLVTGLSYDPEMFHSTMVKDMEHSLALMRQSLVEMRATIETELRKNDVDDSVISEDEMVKSISLHLARLDDLHEVAEEEGGLMSAILAQQKHGAFGGMLFHQLIEESRRIFASSHYTGANEKMKEISSRWVRERHLEGVAQGREWSQGSDVRAPYSINRHTSPALALISMGLGATQALRFGQDAERVREIEAKLKEWRERLQEFESLVGHALDRSPEAESLAALKTFLQKAEKACIARTAPLAAFELTSLEYASPEIRLSNWADRFQSLISASLPKLSRDTTDGKSQTARGEELARIVTEDMAFARQTGLGAYLVASKSIVGVLANGMHYAPEFFSKHDGESVSFQGEDYALRANGHHPWGTEMTIGRENPDGSFLPIASLIQTSPSSTEEEAKVLVLMHQKGAAAARAVRGLLNDEMFGQTEMDIPPIMWNFMDPHAQDGFDIPRKERTYSFWDRDQADRKYSQVLRQYGVGPQNREVLEEPEDNPDGMTVEEHNLQARRYNTLWHKAYNDSLSRWEKRFAVEGWEGKKSQIPQRAGVDADMASMPAHPEIVEARRKRVGELVALFEEYASREAKGSIVRTQREKFWQAAKEIVEEEKKEVSAWFRETVQHAMDHEPGVIPTHEECQSIYEEGVERMASLTESAIRGVLTARMREVQNLEEQGELRAGEEDVLNWVKPEISIRVSALGHQQANVYGPAPTPGDEGEQVEMVPVPAATSQPDDKVVSNFGELAERDEDKIKRVDPVEQAPTRMSPTMS